LAIACRPGALPTQVTPTVDQLLGVNDDGVAARFYSTPAGNSLVTPAE
jgi:hypothetical protein